MQKIDMEDFNADIRMRTIEKIHKDIIQKPSEYLVQAWSMGKIVNEEPGN